MELKDMKIVHIMADGTIRKSIDGYLIPYNENTKIIYELLAQAEKGDLEKVKTKKYEVV